MMDRLDGRAAAAGLGALLLLGGAIWLGSRRFRDYDLVLLPYTLGVLLAAFALAYRCAVWLQRPPTAAFAKRALRVLFRRGMAI